MRLQEKMAKKDITHAPELSQAAVRRKSVLPKSGRGAELSGNLEPTMARLAIRTPYVASETIMTKGVGLNWIIFASVLTLALQVTDTGKDRFSPSAETGNTETSSSRRRLAQLSINALPDHEAGTTKLSTIYKAEKASTPLSEDIADISTQKARLGRRRSSLFKPTDV
jgi:hypothetical protein